MGGQPANLGPDSPAKEYHLARDLIDLLSIFDETSDVTSANR